MGKVTIADNSIWLKHIEQDKPLRDKLKALQPGEAIDLEVAGVVGRWARVKDGKDGRPTEAIQPIESMKQIWTQMQKDRGRVVEVREVLSADSFLAALRPLLSEWDSPEDEEAYRDL